MVREVVLAAALYILAVGRVVVAVSKSCTEDAEGAGVPHKLHTFGVSYIHTQITNAELGKMLTHMIQDIEIRDTETETGTETESETRRMTHRNKLRAEPAHSSAPI